MADCTKKSKRVQSKNKTFSQKYQILVPWLHSWTPAYVLDVVRQHGIPPDFSTSILRKSFLVNHHHKKRPFWSTTLITCILLCFTRLYCECVFLSLTCGLSLRHVSRQGQSTKGSFIQVNTVAGQHDCWQSGCSESGGRCSPGPSPVRSLCMYLSSHLIPNASAYKVPQINSSSVSEARRILSIS